MLVLASGILYGYNNLKMWNFTLNFKCLKNWNSVVGKFEDFPGGSDGKASAYNAGNLGSIPGLRRSPGEGNGKPLQYSCLEYPMGVRAW